jgi:hypothetical protein
MDSSSSVPMRQCQYCRKDFPFIWSGKKLSDGSKLYTDNAGKRWSGKRCPTCERRRVVNSVQCDQFTRRSILQKLAEAGMEIESENLPIRVSKNGKQYKVGVRRAHTENGKVILESDLDEDFDFVAVVFESVRLCPREQLKEIAIAGNPQEAISSATRLPYRERAVQAETTDNQG